MKDFEKLVLTEVCKVFGGNKTALHQFSLTLQKGEFVTFLGPSGCGKSTALNCVAGLLSITSGSIAIDAECIDDSKHFVPPEKRGFGMVFQNYALFPHLTVFNNVAFGLRLKKLSHGEIARKVTDTLKLVHLEGYEHKYPSQMSGGEQQRVAIARCIVMEPRLLMLDEPLSNLDAKLRIDMRYEIKSLHERLKISSIYVTHDQQEALALSDRIVVMKKGEIQQIGTPADIYDRPANLFVADFMGFKNIWPAMIVKLEEKRDQLIVTIQSNELPLVASLHDYDHQHKRRLQEALQNKKRVFTAIRPEDITVGEGSVNAFQGRADVTEYLGQINHLTALSLKNNVRVDIRTTQRIAEGQVVHFGVAPEKIRVFPEE